MFELSARTKDAFGLLLVGVGIIAFVIFLAFNLPTVVEAMLLIIAIILFMMAALVIVGVITAIPYYFVKHGPESEPTSSYRLDDVKPVKEDEGK